MLSLTQGSIIRHLILDLIAFCSEDVPSTKCVLSRSAYSVMAIDTEEGLPSDASAPERVAIVITAVSVPS